MKKLFRIIKLSIKALVLSSLIIVYSCDDFVETDRPNSQLTTDGVFENSTTATAAITDIYAQMRENGAFTGRINGLSSLLGTYSDELVSFESGIYTTANFYTNSLLSSTNYVATIWNRSYSHIYATNGVLEGVNNSTSLTENAKSQLMGEALFVRAFVHFHLVNLFGDVPYVTTTDYIKNSTVTRLPKEMVYQKIISDLETSIGLLNTSYINSSRTRPNKATAQALLARVYLYNNNFASASNMASAVLNDTTNYIWEENLDKVFLKTSTSTIWQLSSGANGANTYEGITFIFLAGPPNKVSLSEGLVSQFDKNDLRKTHWIKQVTNNNTIWSHPYKYKKNNTTATSSENTILFRLAEQYLIRAEARARQKDIIGAKEDLNKIRHRAGLSDTNANSESELIEEILKERNLELFTEFGHRFFDLKRLGLIDEVLNKKPGWSSSDQLWPIPLSELNANPFLSPQNPNY